MITRIAILAIFTFFTSLAHAEIIRIPQNQLEIVVSHDDQPFGVAGMKFSDSKKAISLITHIYENWSHKYLPVLVMKSRTKALMPGEENLHKQIKLLSEKLRFRVIYMPAPTGHGHFSEDEILKLTQAWTKKNRAK